MTADINVPEKGAEGVIACAGAFSAGWTLYVADGNPTFHYNAFELATNTVEGSAALPAGDVQLKVMFKPDAQSKIGGGTLTLMVNGKQVDEGKLERTLFRHGLEPFEVGRDSITPVDPAYAEKEDFEFSGAIQKVEFDLNQ